MFTFLQRTQVFERFARHSRFFFWGNLSFKTSNDERGRLPKRISWSVCKYLWESGLTMIKTMTHYNRIPPFIVMVPISESSGLCWTADFVKYLVLKFCTVGSPAPYIIIYSQCYVKGWCSTYHHIISGP